MSWVFAALLLFALLVASVLIAVVRSRAEGDRLNDGPTNPLATKTRISICPKCEREVECVSFHGQKSYLCSRRNGCGSIGAWTDRASKRNPEAPAR